MSQPIWIIEEMRHVEWRFEQPYHIYKSEESAKRGLERMRKEGLTRFPRRIMEYRPVEVDDGTSLASDAGK